MENRCNLCINHEIIITFTIKKKQLLHLLAHIRKLLLLRKKNEKNHLY